MTAMIAVIGYIRFPPDRMPDVRPHLRALVRATREHDGCIAYDAAEDLLEPGLVRFSELWPDAASLARHQAAPHIEPWRAAARSLGVMDRKFAVYDVSGERPL